MKTFAHFYEELNGEPAENEFLKQQLDFLHKYASMKGERVLDENAHPDTHKYVELVFKGKWKNNKGA